MADLDGVSATTLWTLRNRALEARRPDSTFTDPLAVRMYEAIDTDFERFGTPSQSHPLRALAVDKEINDFLDTHPDGTVVARGLGNYSPYHLERHALAVLAVVALAEGLQTTYWRLGRPVKRWVGVDLPEVITLREKLLPAEDAIEHIAGSALDTSWADGIDTDSGVIITAEGLLMYLEPDEARTLIGFLAARFPGATLVFDSIPHWFSRKTLSGLTLANGYQTPPMPYALTYGEAEKLVEIDGVAEVGDIALPPGRGVWKSSILRRIGDLPLVRDVRPHLLRLRFAD